MKTILVTTDFSESSVNAALYATTMARDLGARIKLMHVTIPEVSFQQSPVEVKEGRELTTAEIQLESTRVQMHTHGGGLVEIVTDLRSGDFFIELHELCREINPYVVIMGSQGSSSSERFLLGSNSVHAMKNLSWPLLAIPPDCIYKGIKKIALASDFENTPSIPMDIIKNFKKDFNATLEVVHVGTDQGVNPQTILKSGVIQEQLREAGAKYHFISKENTEEGIIEFTGANHIDILIVIPKQYGFLDQLFHKSISKHMILHSKVPVMVLQELS